MMLAIIFVLAGFLFVTFLLFLTTGHVTPPANLANLREQMRSLDIEALRNLMDSREEDFLRQNLEASAFRMVQRARLCAAIEYVLLASRNAATLRRFGDSARLSPNPSVARTGDKLANSAIRFRICALKVLAMLYLALLLPVPTIHPLRITEDYEDMNGMVTVLCCFQQQGRREAHDAVAQFV
ncbi:MAG: hypothetical protein ACRD2S_07335 [Terriglobales bacterium]